MYVAYSHIHIRGTKEEKPTLKTFQLSEFFANDINTIFDIDIRRQIHTSVGMYAGT
jgi:hypothetical protein